MTKPKNMTPEQDAAWKEKHYARCKAWHEQNREKVASYQKEYNKTNQEKRKVLRKSWYEANREKAAAQSKAWHESNPEKAAAKAKKWRDANKQKIAVVMKAWRESNKEHVDSYGRSRVRKITDSYVAYRLRIKTKDCPHDLIEFKRQQIALVRAVKQINQLIKEQENDQ